MKIAIVTGATSGIGMEAAIQIDSRFESLDEIWLIGRNEKKLELLSKQLKHSVRSFAMDLCLDSDREEFVLFLKKVKPCIKMLFQSAGVGLHGNFAQRKTKDLLEMIKINCEALTFMASVCIPYMKRNSYMINMASSAGFVPFPGFAVYGATKSYVLQLSRALRYELRKSGIHVVAVCPGPVNTPFFEISERYNKGISAFKKAHMNTPQKVVKRALDAAAFKRSVVVDTPLIGTFRIFSNIIPHDFLVMCIGFFLNFFKI